MTTALELCAHWDVIEMPHGPVSKAKCLKCGREREYENYRFPDYNNKPPEKVEVWVGRDE